MQFDGSSSFNPNSHIGLNYYPFDEKFDLGSFANQNIPLIQTPSSTTTTSATTAASAAAVAAATVNGFNLLKYYESSNNNTKNELNSYLQLEKTRELNQLELNTSELLNRYNLNKSSKFESINFLANKEEIANSTTGSSSHETLLTSSLLSLEGKYLYLFLE